MGIGISLLLFIAVLCVVMLNVPHADALTRSDIYNTKQTIKTIQNTISSLEDSITTQRDTILTLEIELVPLIDKERTAREWDKLNDTAATRNELTIAQSNVDAKQNSLDIANKTLQNLINSKLANKSKLINFEDQLSSDQRMIKNQKDEHLNGLTKVIGIDISKTCKTMVINNYSSTCPSFEDLIGLDTSKKESGEFGAINGYYQRGKPLLHNDERLYDFESEFGIIIDPSGTMKNKIKMITIEISLDNYMIRGDFKKDDNSRTINHLRYVDNCKNATITSQNWESILPDTIHYLRTNCEVTGIDTVEVIHDDVTIIPIDETRYWQDKLWLAETKLNCKGLCFEY